MAKGKGFTLIELLVALVLALVFGIVTTKLLSHTSYHATNFKETTDMAKIGRVSLFLLTRDIANVGYMLNCVGRGCGTILYAPTANAIAHSGESNCYFSGTATDKPPCPNLHYDPLANQLALNYAALAGDEPIQIKYSIGQGGGLLRTEVLAGDTSVTPPVGNKVANNVVAMAVEFGVVDSVTGDVAYSPVLGTVVPSSIRVCVLVQSDLPDKQYRSPTSIPLLGDNSYAVPSHKLHYRFKAIQQEVFIFNPNNTNP
jgi:prepilin-type N-terminal cleavage/methylation domain-containing protein